MGKVFATLLGNDRSLIVRASDRADSIDGLPVDGRDELNFTSNIPAQKIAAQVTFNFTKAGQKLGLQHGFVGVGVLGFGKSMPDSGDHVASL